MSASKTIARLINLTVACARSPLRRFHSAAARTERRAVSTDISNDVGAVKRHDLRSGRRSRLSKAKSRRRRPYRNRRSALSGRRSSTPLRSPVCHNISDGLAHQTSLRLRRTMMIYANSLRWEAGRLFILPVTARWTTSVRRHSRIQALPRRRLGSSATAELVVLGLIASQNPEPDAQLAGGRDASFAESLRLPLAPREPTQRCIALDGMDRRLAPQEPAQGITSLGDFAESLPRTARVFSRNHPDVTGDRLRVGESCRIAEEDFGRQRGDRADARVGHQTAGLRPRARARRRAGPGPRSASSNGRATPAMPSAGLPRAAEAARTRASPGRIGSTTTRRGACRAPARYPGARS